jgi:hypothetical protein
VNIFIQIGRAGSEANRIFRRPPSYPTFSITTIAAIIGKEVREKGSTQKTSFIKIWSITSTAFE